MKVDNRRQAETQTALKVPVLDIHVQEYGGQVCVHHVYIYMCIYIDKAPSTQEPFSLLLVKSRTKQVGYQQLPANMFCLCLAAKEA